MKKEPIIQLFPLSVRGILSKARMDMDNVYEIRLRVNAPLIVVYQGTEYFLTREGQFTHRRENAYLVSAQEVKETMGYVSSYSLYAFEDEVRQGFITIQGGHRVGIAGKAVMEGDKVKSVKYISYVNLRLSHQIKGCATAIMPYLIQEDTIYHTLLISPPRCGKTTMLRDIIRQISDGWDKFPGITVGVVDERSEIGGSYLGIAQNDLGIRTDILDCCPKAEGMMMLIRSMSPSVVAVDELGDYEDIHAIESVIHCGCRLLATVHGSTIEDIKRKPLMQRLMNERIFDRYVILKKEKQAGTVHAIYDARGSCLYQGSGTS
ncbi:stage III sporulation protein AA [Lactonifactor longoviformis]|nr:stage III sporulation protein AA [Lactonifactor longoviformis]MSA01303.1 stage III sporulation protein AA [Lactonifactor sp. BIOML-A5]MSA07323.1 stage III sporulation protein AA [Lactonifactor sp. BIOML-A4]MSA12053.1 stage III sporulation protein AA [Lactonifactor sp. BIOML-A3]MSA16493.1 stage III sporulation protein AA [Lactonifactor sp. BIOML-A2]MSA37304.1 stage III sporulation protein AA [Lactonifactor sp. BIOML-A1]MSB13135.1 stage III sporulation protein AA [Lactonifactor sp. BIOML-A6]